MILGIAVTAALVLYFALAFYVFPQTFQSVGPREPGPAVTNVNMSASEIRLGQSFVISVTATNTGEDADMQLVSIGFPNLTATSNVKVLEHDFAQTPMRISAGDDVGSGYTGAALVDAQYTSVEAFSRPWPGGSIYSIDLQVTPEKQGQFAILVKSVAFPHSWDGAHWPGEGTVDYQNEFVKAYYVQVTTKP
jgi:hypothetical protein